MKSRQQSVSHTASGSKRMQRQLAVLYVAVFIDTIGFGLSLPLMPYFAISFGASDFQIGLMTSGFNLGSLLGNLLLCPLSDRVGRKPVLCICLLANASCYFAFTLAESMEELIMLRMLAGFFSGTVACAKVYVADCTTEEDRARSLADVNVAFALSCVFGPGLGGLCALVSILFGFQVMAVLSALNALVGFLYLEEPPRKTTAPAAAGGVRATQQPSCLDVLRAQPQILVVVLSSGMQYLAYAPFETLGALLLLEQYGLGTSQYSLLSSLGGVVYVLTMKVAFVRVYDAVGGKRTAQLGHVFRGVCYICYAFGSTWLEALVAAILMGLGGFITPANDTTLSLMVDPASRGTVQGINMAVTAGARAIGPLAAVPLFSFWRGLPFVFSAGLMATSTFAETGFLHVAAVATVEHISGR